MTDAHGSGCDVAGEVNNTTILMALRADFPTFRIWREIIPGRTRYIARRLHLEPGLHTVVTDDLTELRDALDSELSSADEP